MRVHATQPAKIMPASSAASPPVLVLFRDDLRVSDNPALHAAVDTGQPVLCVFILDDASADIRPLGGAARWWVHHALADLASRLEALGGRLDVFMGPAAEIVLALAETETLGGCFSNRRYGLGERAVDAAIEAGLAARGIPVRSFNGTLWHEPSEVRTRTGGAFRVFTPFLRAALALGPTAAPLPAPRTIRAAPPPRGAPGHVTLDELGLLPTKPDWSGGLAATWTPGESAAQAKLRAFLDAGLPTYGEDRNRPALPATSTLSPHLRHGEISPRQVIAQASHAADDGTAAPHEVEKFVSEVVWRDFAYNLLVDHPALAEVPVQPTFVHFAFRPSDGGDLEAWRRGRTGYPIVDAGMRQLWTTGFMHNRVRMITASFLVKHLLIDWRVGERWFWDTLCDADPASNPTNWQWVAGCGADPSPFFRIFNPTLQGEKFDTKGDYIRAFVPELAAVPNKWVHRPWAAPPEVLVKAGVRLGTDYPHPIVDHDLARRRALQALAQMRQAS